MSEDTAPEIRISSKKTWFMPRFSSSPPDGRADFVCPEFFNISGGTLTYSGGTIVDNPRLCAEENTSANERSGMFTISAFTNQSEYYASYASVVCAWTITQEGGGDI